MNALSIQLPPNPSRRVVLYADQRRVAMGWSRKQLAEKANAAAARDSLFSLNLLEVWCSKARLGRPQRIDLDKALVLLAVCGCESNRVGALVAELGDAVVALVDEAVPDAAV